MEEEKVKTAYIASYQSNDSSARKKCDTVLLFGRPNDPKSDISVDFSWKHVELPCPVCGFTHLFKRIAWFNSVQGISSHTGATSLALELW